MPVSGDLEAARRIRDSLEQAVTVQRDSTTAADSAKKSATDSSLVNKPDTLAQTLPVQGSASLRYHIIAGSFKEHENAAKLGEILKKLGTEPVYIDFKSGARMVSAGGYATVEEARRAVETLLAKEGAPGDLWIYDTKR